MTCSLCTGTYKGSGAALKVAGYVLGAEQAFLNQCKLTTVTYF